jgi:ribonuclease HI
MYVRGTRVPIYRVLEILAAPYGDVKKAVDALQGVELETLRESLSDCAKLLKVLEENETHDALKSGRKSGPPESRIIDNAADVLRELDRVKIYVDGSSRGNPGPAAFGYVFKDLKDNILLVDGKYIGSATANTAEAMAIIVALRKAQDLGKPKVHLFSDSELLINQINGDYRIRNKELLKLHKEIQSLKSRFKQFQAIRIERKLNADADDVARRILDRVLETQTT